MKEGGATREGVRRSEGGNIEAGWGEREELGSVFRNALLSHHVYFLRPQRPLAGFS